MRVPVSAQTKRLRGEVKDMKRTDADDDEVRFHRDAGAAGAVPGEVHACACMHLCARVWSPALHASVYVLFFICGGRPHTHAHTFANTRTHLSLCSTIRTICERARHPIQWHVCLYAFAPVCVCGRAGARGCTRPHACMYVGVFFCV